MAMGTIPPLGSFEEITLREFMIHDRSRRVAKAKLIAFLGANKENLKGVNQYLKEYINSEYRVEDLIADMDLKLMEEYEEMQGTSLQAHLNDEGVLMVSGFDT